jgi:hypothetical protein
MAIFRFSINHQSPCGPPSPRGTGRAASNFGIFIGHFAQFLSEGVPLFFQKGEQGGFLFYKILKNPLFLSFNPPVVPLRQEGQAVQLPTLDAFIDYFAQF